MSLIAVFTKKNYNKGNPFDLITIFVVKNLYLIFISLTSK